MRDALREMIRTLDNIVDSGNMILVQLIFLLVGAIIFATLVFLDESHNNFIQNSGIREFLAALSLVLYGIAGSLWLYHRMVRGDSFH